MVLTASRAANGFALFGTAELFAPPLMWSEFRSALHEAVYRGEVDGSEADSSLSELAAAPVVARTPRQLGRVAWEIADEHGWAKTYDAEYVALARLLGCRLVTLDARLRRATEPLGFVIGPAEL